MLNKVQILIHGQSNRDNNINLSSSMLRQKQNGFIGIISRGKDNEVQ